MLILGSEENTVVQAPGYNWGTGRLVQYESVASFALEFCSVNNVNRRTLEEVVPRIAAYPLGPIGDEVCIQLAEYLGEPLELLRTLGSGAEISTVQSWRIEGSPKSELRYCPACLKRGLHFGFQENRCFKTCLIHGAALQWKWLPQASPGSHFEKKMRLLGELLDQSIPDWRNRSPKERNSLDAAEMSALRSMGKWCQQLSEDLRSGLPRYEHVSSLSIDKLPAPIFCERMLSLVDAPTDIRSHLDIRCEPRQPIVIDLPAEATRLINQIRVDARISFHDFFWLFIKTTAMQRRSRSYSVAMSRQWTAAFGRSRHEGECNCQWYLDSFVGWRKISPSCGPYHKCPYRFTRGRFVGRWLRLADDDASSRNLDAIWCWYIDVSRALIASETGVLECVNGDIPYRYPSHLSKLNWKIPGALASTLEKIAIAAAHTEVSVIDSWLQAIANGETPRDLYFPEAEVDFAATENSASVSIWPPEIFRKRIEA